MSKDKLAEEIVLENVADYLEDAVRLEKLGLINWPAIMTSCAKRIRSAIAALRCEDGEMRKDVERLDYLESEAVNEPPWPALFRKNVPITRAAIDAARAEVLKG